MIAYAAVSLLTSFAGSFFCFVIWIHFDLEDHLEKRHQKHGREIENEQRKQRGLGPV